MKLTDDKFISVIDATPLVSIDLIVGNERGEILLGRRCNRPAQNYWFVPGGRVRKNERVQDALQRIGQSELRMPVPLGRLLGAFDHFYEDNFYGLADISTHYITLAYQLEISSSSPFIHDEQHVEMRWWDMESMHASQEVHENTKRYFSKSTEYGFRVECV